MRLSWIISVGTRVLIKERQWQQCDSQRSEGIALLTLKIGERVMSQGTLEAGKGKNKKQTENKTKQKSDSPL